MSAARAILEVKWGPSGGTKATIAPGGTLKVGRTERADLVIAHDRDMSAVHFELSWDGTTCRVRDAKSVGGTLVDGLPAAEATIDNGGWIKAGDTVFTVFIEERRPPRDPDAVMTPQKQLALESLQAEQAPLFAIVDASRSVRVLEVVRESVEACRSLYEGPQGEVLADVAPHLVALPRGSRLLPRLVQEGWGKRWASYLASPASLADVRSHLRRFAKVHDEASGELAYFRFYDPAILRVFLGCATPLQRRDFFGPIVCFWAEDERGDPRRFVRGDATGD